MSTQEKLEYALTRLGAAALVLGPCDEETDRWREAVKELRQELLAQGEK